MYIIGIGTATPAHRYTQADCWQALQASTRFGELNSRSQVILKKVLTGDSGIATRHFGMPQLDHAFDLTPDALHARFREHAPALATKAAREALAQAETTVEEIDAVLISTCTGYLCPGLTSYVSEQLGLRQTVLALDLVGQGCGAAIPNLQTAQALLAGGTARRVLSICVEVCSAAFFLDDDPGVLISACLFGDGAAAAVLSATPGQGRGVRWKRGSSLLKPADRDLLRFDQKQGMLRNILTPDVPALAAQHAATVFASTLASAQVTPEQITGWIWHPGGRNVLQALCEKFQLTEAQVQGSRTVLSEYGNMSSPSVLFVLQAALRNPTPGGLWWMSSFGAGFSCHGALLEVAHP
ncbi:MAG TPA: 3-oxoacyl-[acyl-carrier-protein] synthase III C-terminal domain-containing protein [Dongiaceae bacterium]|nr:3-oxoacyl-[acyl-carrier-protein] synthase III C-terminal domain-containing protein [Dongiaceae bacterium]